MSNIFKIILLAFLLLSSLHSQELQKISLQLQWKYTFQFAGFIMAKEKGYYKEHGLDVQLKEYNNTDTIHDLTSNKVDFLINNNTILHKDKKLLDVTLLATYFQRSPLVFATQPEIKKVLDLKGKKLMLSPDDIGYSPIARLLEHFDINSRNTKFVNQTFSLDSFINKTVDAIVIFSSNETYVLDNKNISYNIIDPNEYGFSTSSINLYTTHKTLENDPELVSKFLEANKKGWEYALNNVDESIQVIHDKYNSKSTLEALRFEAEATRKFIMPNLYSIGSINYEFVENTYKRLLHGNKLLKNQDISKIVYQHDFSSKKAVDILLIFKGILAAIGIVLLGLLVRYIYIKQKFLKMQNNFQSQIIEQVHDSVISTDLEGTIVSWNQGSKKILGYDKEEVIGKNMSLIHRPEDVEKNIEYAIRLQKEGAFSVESYLLTKDKKEIYVLITLSVLKDSNGVAIGLLGVSKDISKRKEMEDELLEQKNILDWHAHHDTLTALPNRLLFYDRLNEGIKRSKRNSTNLALFFLDLDRFKEVNDTLGHAIGDKLLKKVSSLLKSILREEDTLSRLGGDEFTIIINDLHDVTQVSYLAEKVINLLNQDIKIDEHIVKISGSLGISIYPQDTSDLDTLLKYADDAMYIAKKDSRNNFKYYNDKVESAT